MLHESKKLEQRFAQNQLAVNSFDSNLPLKMPQNMAKEGQLSRDIIVNQGLYPNSASNGTNFNDVAEFEIYDRKFKQ